MPPDQPSQKTIKGTINTAQFCTNLQSTLFCVTSKIAAARNRVDLAKIIQEDLLDDFSTNYYRCCLYNSVDQTLTPLLYSNNPKFTDHPEIQEIFHSTVSMKDGVWEELLLKNKPVIYTLADLKKHFPLVSWINACNKFGIKELFASPIINGGELKGLLCLYSCKSGFFDINKGLLLTGIAEQFGTGICNVLANEKLESQLAQINASKQQLEEENLYLLETVRPSGNFAEVIGTGAKMQKVLQLVAQVADSNSTVLLLGETGTGKEVIAKAVHNASMRKDKLMIKVNCAALPANLIESALFGHERGSFTGASERRLGKFELANGSTLFLDEIGELPIELQVKLLRVLQEKEIERVGGHATIKVNVRIIAATSRNLQKEVDAGRFRADLFYRLNVFPITLPPLRKRKEDIPVLVSHFINLYSGNAAKKVKRISKTALETLVSYAWPGNVRELEHLVERSVLLTNGTTIKNISLPENNPVKKGSSEDTLVIKTLAEMERNYILQVIKFYNGRISGPNGAAIKLGLPSTTLISKMKKLQIKKEHVIIRKTTT